MSQSKRRLEAIPLKWETLSDAQRDAVTAASGWLVDAINDLDLIPKRQKSRSSGPVLDRNRRSQLGFIDGDRGTGKSSVLLTLMDLTSLDTLDWAPPDGLVKTLRDQRRRVVWLEPLDMEPLSRGANLFAAILARIAQVLDTRLGDAPPPMAAAFADLDSYADVASRLQQLQNDVAVVWDRLDGKDPSGDPQTRALGVVQAEKAGLELTRRIGEVLDGIAGILSSHQVDNPLFVLPVDDFDLAPAHCLELLRLIRMVTTPRLFFLVAGNTRIAESVMKLRSEGELSRLAGGKPSNAAEVQNHALEIAANNMRKLIPPGQRARLAVLRLPEALDLGKK